MKSLRGWLALAPMLPCLTPAYYYPEAWPESQWARDMANMRKLGMEYQFAWLEKNVALAAQNGMKVILCTPTAAPPVWLSRKHPETLNLEMALLRKPHAGAGLAPASLKANFLVAWRDGAGDSGARGNAVAAGDALCAAGPRVAVWVE